LRRETDALLTSKIWQKKKHQNQPISSTTRIELTKAKAIEYSLMPAFMFQTTGKAQDQMLHQEV
jgi:hypothetical protein